MDLISNKIWDRTLKQKEYHNQNQNNKNLILDIGFSPGGSDSKESSCSAGDLGSIPRWRGSPGGGNGNPLQYLAWRIPWTEEPGRLQSIDSQSPKRLTFTFTFSRMKIKMYIWDMGSRRGRLDEMVGWNHQLDGHEFQQTPGVGNQQRSLACFSPWGCKELNTTEWLIWIDT